MTRRILVALAAATALVFIAFMYPFWVGSALWPESQLSTKVALEVAPLASQVGWLPKDEAADTVRSFSSTTGHPTTVFFADGSSIGDTSRGKDPVVDELIHGTSGSGFGAFFVQEDDGRTLLLPIATRSGDIAVIRTFVPEGELAGVVRKARMQFLALGVALAAASVAVGLLLSRSFLKPISALADVAGRLAAGDLEARVQPEGPQEIQAVGNQLNRLADRVAELLSLQREEVADMAHRLRTPITALKLDADSRSPESADRVMADVELLERMVDDLIREARRPIREGMGAGCDAVAVVGERAEFWSVLAEDQGRLATVELPAVPVIVRASADDLGDAVDALIGNVFSHTDEGVAYRITLSASADGGATLQIADAGGGIGDATLLQRGRSAAGSTGLGLDIARRTAENSGGMLTVSRAPEGGASITLNLGPANTYVPTRVPVDRGPTTLHES